MLKSVVSSTVVTLLLIASPPVNAQQKRPLESGEQVCVTIFEYVRTQRVGTYRGMSDGVFEFVPEGSDSVRQVDVNSLRRIQVQRGRKGNAATGAAVGGVPFAVLAMLVYASDPADGGFNGGYMVQYGLVAGAIGAMGGALIGAYIRSDRWEDVLLNQLQMRLTPQSNMLGIGFRFRFAF